MAARQDEDVCLAPHVLKCITLQEPRHRHGFRVRRGPDFFPQLLDKIPLSCNGHAHLVVPFISETQGNPESLPYSFLLYYTAEK